MRILLPPSGGKEKPEGGEPVALDSLAFADGLSEKRAKLLAALDPSLCEAPAAEVYAGVLYQRLDLRACRQQRGGGPSRAGRCGTGAAALKANLGDPQAAAAIVTEAELTGASLDVIVRD